MSLSPGTTLGSFEISGLIDFGGNDGKIGSRSEPIEKGRFSGISRHG